MKLVKKIVVGLALLVLSTAPTISGQPTVIEVLPTRTGASGSGPYTFNTTSFTQINTVTPGASCGSCFGAFLYPSETMSIAKRVVFEFALYDAPCGSTVPCAGTAQVRLVSYYWDNSVPQQPIFNRAWPAMSKKPQGNPSFVQIDVTEQWNAYMQTIPSDLPPASTLLGFFPEVKGSGSLYLARIYIEY